MSIIVVAGCTGTGKTKLGVEIALEVNGEVISADSMQIYQGLDIISNTVTEEEMRGIPHHCINYVPVSQSYDVQQYVNYTIPIIKDILNRGKVPVIVGGTAYYIEALCWQFTLTDLTATHNNTISVDDLKVLNDPTLSDHEKLKAVDPPSAEVIHPNNVRRIERCLEIIRYLGVKRSALIQEQQEENQRGKMRWDSILLFSLESELSVLDSRLDKRVDTMVDLGLRRELDSLVHHSTGDSGLLSQVIGFKEFEKYLELQRSGTEDLSASGALGEGLDRMKCRTRQYARKQLRWIKSRLSECSDPGYYFRRLDSSVPEQWADHVSMPAMRDVRLFIQGTLQDNERNYFKKDMGVRSCRNCEVVCEGEEQFRQHLTSRKHKKRVSSLRKRGITEVS
eukprot:sb/3465463/